jgi:hypothetical protein
MRFVDSKARLRPRDREPRAQMPHHGQLAPNGSMSGVGTRGFVKQNSCRKPNGDLGDVMSAVQTVAKVLVRQTPAPNRALSEALHVRRLVMMHRGETPRGESSTRATLVGEDAPRACAGEAELPAASPRFGRRDGSATLAVRRRPASVKTVSRPLLVGGDRCSDPLGADDEARGRGGKLIWSCLRARSRS